MRKSLYSTSSNMKLVTVTYYGFTTMDRRFSGPMLPWIVSEIKRRNYSEKLSLGIEEGILQAYNQDFELQFVHKVSQITRFSQGDTDACTFLYLMRDDHENLLYCYLYQAQKAQDVTDLYKQMKEQNHTAPTRSISSAANLTSLCVDISPSSSNFFEVLYIGKIKVWQKKVPDSFVDESLEKFKSHELEKLKLRQLGTIGKLKSENDISRRSSGDSCASETSSEENNNNNTPQVRHQALFRSQSFQSHLPLKLPIVQDSQPEREIEKDQEVSVPVTIATIPETESGDEPGRVRDFKSSVEIDDHNRTMVLQVDRTDLRLISPDRKVILLHKHHRDVTTCVQGQARPEHFGFICKEGVNSQIFTGYIFKCESSSIANDACAAITQAFLNAESRPRTAVTSCEHCPMVWYHKLCVEIEHLTDRKTQAAIFRKIEQLEETEQQIILTKFRGAETDSVREQNEFLMMLLRAHCEMKQGRHVHDTAENRSEFLNQYLGGSTIFTKAKRSFDQLLKRKGSRDDFGGSLKGLNLPIHNNLNRDTLSHSPSPSIADVSDRDSEGTRSRTSTIGSQSDIRDIHDKHSGSPEKTFGSEKALKSPMMDIFLKVGNSPKSNNMMVDSGLQNVDTSWRQAIFKRVSTPRKEEKPERTTKRTKEELKILWKKSIYQAILLVRMEKENAKIRAKQEESAVKRIKLEYDEMKPNQREVMDVWEMVTNKENDRIKCDNHLLLQAIRQGVPRGKRGEVWQFLAEQYCARVPPIDISKYPNYNVPYETLLKQLTSHQHAILIDLGRTFPNHSYFSSPLGPGQLALFNLLKAYSLLDPEVGYCQGLSFVAGVLLLHMEEHQAFFLLRHLMFRRAMRHQYLPDMVSLQIKLYQLSRLIHDQLPEIYEHFDYYEVAPTLYAAPWILTVFASQFPLGFVTRVFDLMFLEGPDVIFRVALALLTYHKDKLMQCESFEEIMDYLKTQLPDIDKPTLDKVMKQVFTSEIGKQLNEYKVEYQVLQEEMASVQPQMETLHKLEIENKALSEQNKTLISQLDSALSNVQRLEKIRVLQQSQLNRLEIQSRGLDVTIATLGNFISNIIDQKIDIDIPDDVRRIISQIQSSERQKSQQNNLLKMLQMEHHPDKPMIKSLSTGKISLPSGLDQNVFRTNSLNTQQIVIEPKTSPSNSTEKISKFFSNSHNNILKEKINAQNNILGTKIDIKVDEVEGDKISPASSIDSGLSTPMSPKAPAIHPLSNCDVNFTFNGSRELQNIKEVRNSRGGLVNQK